MLVTLPKHATIAGIGMFLIAYSIYSMRQGEAVTMVSRGWGPGAGLVGGTMGTLFGAGAPPYAIYLARRLGDRAAFRATLSNMVLLSTSIRALVFLAGGLMLADRLIAFVLLVPFALAGLWAGNRLQRRLSRASLLRLVSVLLFLIGLSLLARALTGG